LADTTVDQARACPLAGEVLFQLPDDVGVQAGGQVGEGGQLDGLAQELRIGHAFRIDPGNEQADLRKHLNESLLGKEDEAFAYGRAAYAERGGQIILRQGPRLAAAPTSTPCDGSFRTRRDGWCASDPGHPSRHPLPLTCLETAACIPVLTF
jgi:hypothetical protein